MQVMILAAGFGKRMLPLTADCPKPLLPLAGKPLIEYHLDKLKQPYFSKVVINVSYLGDKIINSLGQATQAGLPIGYSVEDEPLETAGGIEKARSFFEENAIFVINADAYCELDFQAWSTAALKQMKLTGAKACLLLVENPNHNPHGDFVLRSEGEQSSQLDEFFPVVPKSSMPKSNLAEPTLTFCGMSILDLSLFDDYKTESGRLADILIQAMNDGLVIGSQFQGLWCDVGTPERLVELNEAINKTV